MQESVIHKVKRWFALKPPALRTIIGINISIYAVWVILGSRISSVASFVSKYLLTTSDPLSILVKPWTLISSGFLHLELGFWGLISFVFVVYWLVWLGQEFEELYGSKSMWQVFLGSTVAGSLLFILTMSIFTSSAVLYGSWAAIFGIGAVQATLNPDRSIGLFLLGVVPLKWLLAGFGALLLLFNPAEGMAVAGGGLFGFLYAKFALQGNRKASSKSTSSDSGVLEKIDSWLGKKSTPSSEKSKSRKRNPKMKKVDISDATIIAEVTEAEIDSILEKISDKGFDSLTAEEKQKLYAASSKDN